MEKYLVKADYYCQAVATGGQWTVIESENKPELGVIKEPKACLPNHECKRYYESQACEDDETCFWQTILEIMPFSTQEAKRLKAGKLESCLENAA